MEVYKDFRFFLKEDDDIIREYLHSIGFFFPSICPTCNQLTRLSLCGRFWICRRSTPFLVCRTHVSIKANTFFRHMKISLKNFFYILNEWRKNVIAEITAIDLELPRSVVQDWYNRISKAFLAKVKYEMPLSIGGPGKIVEFDETLLVRRKYNRGRILSGQKWAVAGVERGLRTNFFVEGVPRRNRACLIPIIVKRILPGSIILTDDWGAYKRLERYTRGMEYSHFTVVHSSNFVDPYTRAHTQTIEGTNSVMKRLLRMRGTNLGDIQNRLDAIIEERHKIFRRLSLFNYVFEAIIEFSAFN